MIFDWEKESILDGSMVARSFAPTNIALAKYWGKRDLALNLPHNGSISVTLDTFGSFTTVEFNESFTDDLVIFDGETKPTSSSFHKKVFRVLEELRQAYGASLKARVQTKNNFPTGAGLASSASGLASVTLAGNAALRQKFNKDLSLEFLSTIARKGSGSACRSLFPGFVEWARGGRADGVDSFAKPLAPQTHWHLKALIAIVTEKEKAASSTDAMERTRATSPFFDSWVKNATAQLPAIREAITTRDFPELCRLAENNCLAMHACAMASTPPLIYWAPETLQIIETVKSLREQGLKVFFTIDAGPNVVIFHREPDDLQIREALAYIPGLKFLSSQTGPGAQILKGDS